MKLEFHHRGRQFFFITVGLVGRPEVMSQIVAGEKRPRVSWLGEAVRAGFRALHKVYYALPPRYDPSAEDSREIAAGRMAILALHDDTDAISGLAMKRDATAAHQFRANCLAMNEIGARLCE